MPPPPLPLYILQPCASLSLPLSTLISPLAPSENDIHTYVHRVWRSAALESVVNLTVISRKRQSPGGILRNCPDGDSISFNWRRRRRSTPEINNLSSTFLNERERERERVSRESRNHGPGVYFVFLVALVRACYWLTLWGTSGREQCPTFFTAWTCTA